MGNAGKKVWVKGKHSLVLRQYLSHVEQDFGHGLSSNTIPERLCRQYPVCVPRVGMLAGVSETRTVYHLAIWYLIALSNAEWLKL